MAATEIIFLGTGTSELNFKAMKCTVQTINVFITNIFVTEDIFAKNTTYLG